MDDPVRAPGCSRSAVLYIDKILSVTSGSCLLWYDIVHVDSTGQAPRTHGLCGPLRFRQSFLHPVDAPASPGNRHQSTTSVLKLGVDASLQVAMRRSNKVADAIDTIRISITNMRNNAPTHHFPTQPPPILMLRPLLLNTLRLPKPPHMESLTDPLQQLLPRLVVRIVERVWVLHVADVGGWWAAGEV